MPQHAILKTPKRVSDTSPVVARNELPWVNIPNTNFPAARLLFPTSFTLRAAEDLSHPAENLHNRVRSKGNQSQETQ
jgi:hypothetical protein